MAHVHEMLARRWFEEVWNKGREQAIDEMFAADGVAHGLANETGEKLRGPVGFKPFFRSFRNAFPDIQVTIEDAISEGDKIAVRCAVRGTHAGDGIGIASTNKPVEFTGMSILRIADGKIAEAWNNFDFATMFKQLGIT